jgi:acyl carrier protein phosphodiesterase
MNLLAHQYLSFQIPDIQLGNLYGEIVRARDYLNYAEGIQKGILLHREIDSFTDSHEVVKRSTRLFHKNQGKYSPVIVDVLYDYFLIKNWDTYSDIPFENFVTDCYQLFEENLDEFPESLRYMMQYLLEYDWFRTYQTHEGIHQTLKGMSKRTKFENNMGEAVNELIKFEEELNEHFNLFFPDLIIHCKDFLKDIYNFIDLKNTNK